jgi:hypothetical protein
MNNGRLQKNLVLYAWAARDGLGWYPGIVRRFPGSNHNIHITPPRLGFLPGRFSFVSGPYGIPGSETPPSGRAAPPRIRHRPMIGRFFMPCSCEAVSGCISGFSRAATHILESHINSSMGFLWPLGGNPDALRSIGRRGAGSWKMTRPGLWTTKTGRKLASFLEGLVWQKIGPEPKSRESRESCDKKIRPTKVVSLIVV